MKTLLLTAVILLSGCVTTQPADTQVSACDHHGGVHSYNSNKPHVDVYCNDGTYHKNW